MRGRCAVVALVLGAGCGAGEAEGQGPPACADWIGVHVELEVFALGCQVDGVLQVSAQLRCADGSRLVWNDAVLQAGDGPGEVFTDAGLAEANARC